MGKTLQPALGSDATAIVQVLSQHKTVPSLLLSGPGSQPRQQRNLPVIQQPRNKGIFNGVKVWFRKTIPIRQDQLPQSQPAHNILIKRECGGSIQKKVSSIFLQDFDTTPDMAPFQMPLSSKFRDLMGVRERWPDDSSISVSARSDYCDTSRDETIIGLKLIVLPMEGRFERIAFTVKLPGCSFYWGDGIVITAGLPEQSTPLSDVVNSTFKKTTGVTLNVNVPTPMGPAGGASIQKGEEHTYEQAHYTMCSPCDTDMANNELRWTLTGNVKTLEGLSGPIDKMAVKIKVPKDCPPRLQAAIQFKGWYRTAMGLKKTKTFPKPSKYRMIELDLSGETQNKFG
ncbi:hypothetical protein M422DRAFT_250422 [Sphaerobolus stellatus SS14]|uniref:Uncharacterized protein n=1 Tax=Sphaerobolus stellatus (strain SS14) TaxID=990650 RepID=A0A0C9VG77_SPHS4|nr:hypothetical protein M422DRAFT_250422 [Sphaerobolus stellatus SS14]